MEDEYYVANGGRFAAVFDGHGGVGVAQYLKKQLYPYVTHHLLLKHWEESDDVDVDYDQAQDDASAGESGNDDEAERDSSQAPGRSSGLDSGTAPGPTAHFRRRASGRGGPEGAVQVHQRPSLSSHVGALRAAFEQVEREVIEDDNLEFQGSTAVAVVVYESEDGHRTLLSANVGDSRAVLSRGGRAVDLTHDHKPNDEKEKARIMALGETIEWDQDCKVHRVRNLSLARAIGDRYAKPAVSPEVDIQLFPVVESEDEFVLLASDGLWDVMSSQDAVTFVHDYMRKELASSSRMSREAEDSHRLVLRRNMAKFLAREAIRKGSSDNVSVLMVWL
jgi:serine/threonine protein phosphatase PrpC